MDYKLKGKVAIIGGGSKGLGKACAISLAKEGVNIVLCARNEETLEETRKKVELYGVEVLALSVDMSNEDDNERIVKETIDRFGRVDILVNNSGGPEPGSFRDFSMEDFDQAYKSVLRYIINITSMAVKEPSPTMVLSNIFRTAVVSFAKSISKDIMGKDITINNICPGYFRTDRITELMEKEADDASVSRREYELKVMAGLPHKRFMSPDELGDMVAYLCSPQARSITGTTIQIDGGVNSGLL